MTPLRAVPLVFTCFVAFGCGGNASAPERLPARRNPAVAPALDDVSIEWQGRLFRHDVAAGVGTGYVLIEGGDGPPQIGDQLFTIGSTDVVSEPLSFWASWAGTDGAGNLLLVGGPSRERGNDVYRRDGAAWQLDQVMPREFVGVDAALAPDGALTMLGSVPQASSQQLRIVARDATGWTSTSTFRTVPYFSVGRGAVTLDRSLVPRAFFWRDAEPDGLYEWVPSADPVLVIPTVERQGTIVAARPAGSLAAVSVTLPDGVHAIVDDAGTIRDIVAPGTQLILPKCVQIAADPNCAGTCTDTLDGASPDASALAVTGDGRLWLAYVAGHFEQEVKYSSECGEGGCQCKPLVGRESTRAELVVAQVAPGASVPVQIVWRTELEMTHAIEVDARGSELHLVAGNFTGSALRYFRLDTAKLGAP